MADPRPYQEPLALAQAAAQEIGDRVQVRSLHLSMFPAPTLHIGYVVGRANGDGVVEGRTHTVPLTLEQIEALNPAEASGRLKNCQSLVAAAYAMLQEQRAVGTGTRTA